MTLGAVDLHAVHARLHAVDGARHVDLDHLAHLARRELVRDASRAGTGDGRRRDHEGHDAGGEVLAPAHVELADQQSVLGVAYVGDAAQAFDAAAIEDGQCAGTEGILRLRAQGLGDDGARASLGERAIERQHPRAHAIVIGEVGRRRHAHDAVLGRARANSDRGQQVREQAHGTKTSARFALSCGYARNPFRVLKTGNSPGKSPMVIDWLSLSRRWA